MENTGEFLVRVPRRTFLGTLGAVAAAGAVSRLGGGGTAAVAIQNPRLLPPDPLPCERIALGEPDDYKPCIARLPDGELLLTAVELPNDTLPRH